MARNKKTRSRTNKKNGFFKLEWVPSLPFSTKTIRLVIFALVFANLGAFYMIYSLAAGLDQGVENDQFSRINNERKKRSIATVKKSGCLTEAARAWSTYMAKNNVLKHSSLSSHVGKYCKSGGSWTKLGENVGRGGSSSSIFSAFMNSSGHRAIIVDSAYNLAGTGGYIDGSGRVWVTQLFARCSGCSGDWTRAPATITTTSTSTTTQGLTGKKADFAISKTWINITSPDLDNDGDDELLFHRKSDGLVSIYSGTITSLGSHHHKYNVSTGWDIVLSGNLDGKGRDETIFYNRSTGQVVILNTSTSSRGAMLGNFTISKGWDNIVAGDLDGDGDDELIFHRKSDGLVMVYQGALTGLGSRLHSYNVSTSWDKVLAANLNSTKKDELMFYNRSSGAVAILNTSISSRGAMLAQFTISKGWDIVSSANLDGDGDDELLFYRRSDGKFMIYEGVKF